MGTLGSLGDIVFSVSAEQVRTFDDMKWDVSARYSVHNRHLLKPLAEYTGPDAEKISFTMQFSALLGVNPRNEIGKLVTATRNGKVMRLVIGGQPYGYGRWVIEKLSNRLERFDNTGTLLFAKADVTLLAYADR